MNTPSFSLQDRATYYRERARDALLQAELAGDAGRKEQRESFLHMARGWHAAATEIEERLRRVEGHACEIWNISSGRVRRVA